MSITFAMVRAKLKADEEKAARRREMRRGYSRAARERKRAAASGLDDLPSDVAVAIEESLALPASTPEPPTPADVTVEELAAKLEAIKERVFRLHAVFANTLSFDAAIEANGYLVLFQKLAVELERKDASALENIVRGHESLLLSPPVPVRRAIPLELQRSCELRWEVSHSPNRRAPKPPTISDGLDWLVG